MAAITGGPSAPPRWSAHAHAFVQPQEVRHAPDELLWIAIQQLQATSSQADDTPFDRRIESAIGRNETLIEKLRSYQRLYPGGPHFEAAAEYELEALFELGTLRSDLSRLESRLAEIDERPGNHNIHAIAAWWQIQLSSLATPAGIPARTGLIDRDQLRVQAMAAFARRFPRSPLAIRAATLAGEECVQRRDIESARAWVEWMTANAPGTPDAARLAGLLCRAEAIGKPMSATFPAIDGSAIDLTSLRGSRVGIAIWNASDATSRQFAGELQRMVAARPDLRVVGVDLSESLEETRRVAAALGLTWTQTNDRRGRGGDFVRKWGIEDAPSLILLDVAGSIRSIAGPADVGAALQAFLTVDAPQSQPAAP